MKKSIALLLLFALLFSLVSCDQTDVDNTDTSDTADTSDTQVKDDFASPADERKTTKTFTAENDDVKIEFTVEGYASESLGEEFYLKSNGIISASAKATNISDQAIYQTINGICHFSSPSDCHEFTFNIKSENDISLLYDDSWHPSLPAGETWSLEAGETYERTDLHFIVGEEAPYDAAYDASLMDIQQDEFYTQAGFCLFGSEVYENGVLDFSGTVSFEYTFDDLLHDLDIIEPEMKSLSCDVDLKVYYLPPDGSEKAKVFEAPEDEVKTSKTFTSTNEDGLTLEFTVQGYASESLGEEFYLKRNEIVLASAKIINTSDRDVYGITKASCHNDPTKECAHEFAFNIEFEKNIPFSHNTAEGGCKNYAQDYEQWTLAAGNSLEYAELDFAAGYGHRENFADLHIDPEKQFGFYLYESSLYDLETGTAECSGTVSFEYYLNTEDPETETNSQTISCDVSLKVFYLPFENEQ